MAVHAHIYVDSFAIALWLYAQGFRPISAGLNPANGKTKFIFPADAQSAYESYMTAKDELNRLAYGAGR
jgi:hypothetical protein